MSKARKIKYMFFLMAWLVLVTSVVFFAAQNKLSTLHRIITSYNPELHFKDSSLGAFSYLTRDTKLKGAPGYSIRFDNLLTESGRLGIFRTGLHKRVKIRKLDLVFYKSSDNINETNEMSPDISIAPLSLDEDLQTLIKNFFRLINPKNGWRVDIDIKNIAEVFVNDFDYKVFYDNELFLSIKSKRVITSYKNPKIVLRSHVTIKTAENNIIESNHVEWDMQNKCFNVRGVYALNRNGVKTLGRDITLDFKLNEIKNKQVAHKTRENKKCFVKM